MSNAVREMFSEISTKYDLMNDILSFGTHRIWRKKLVRLLNLNSNSSVLDLASGTGDLAFDMNAAGAKVIGTDFCEDMLVVARQKAKERGINIEFRQADALSIPYGDSMFDASTISFGIRNVDDVSLCLKEMARVVKSGGKAAILEFGQAKQPMAFFYNIYSKYIMPALGRIFAGAESAYTYLPQTAAKFPCDQKFLDIMNATGMYSETKVYSLFSGIAYIYIGTVK
jgi:demethylmenaquinone methyltransferase/2-methoxy-6-polyprenyl-1,4-benzoquinol methylase